MKTKSLVSSVILALVAVVTLAAGPKQTMLMNRLGPS